MSGELIKEKEEELKIFETELEELKEDIEDINKKIIRYNNKIQAIHDMIRMKLSCISKCYLLVMMTCQERYLIKAVR